MYNTWYIDAFPVLRTTPRLVFCKIIHAPSQMGVRIIPPILELTSLKTLLIPDYHCFDEYLDNLIAPSLEELSLSSSYKNVPVDVITSFLKISDCYQ